MPSIDDDDTEPGLRIAPFVATALILVTAAAIGYNALFLQKGKDIHLARDGVLVQPDRLGQLLKQLTARDGPVVPEMPPQERATYRVVEPPPPTGSTKPAASALVKAVQEEMAAIGAYVGETHGLSDDATRRAVEMYQAQNGLAVTGEADQRLLDRLRFDRRIAEAAGLTGGAATDVAAGAADAHSAGEVRRVQVRLAELGYAPGPIDGELGERTVDAIIEFQRDRRLPASGRITQQLLEELDE